MSLELRELKDLKKHWMKIIYKKSCQGQDIEMQKVLKIALRRKIDGK